MSDVKMLQIPVSKAEHEKLVKLKKDMSWHDYVCRDI